ncbi:ESX-1 secretion-associated protein EspI-like, partial [Amphibalanus amphitrite]|uniref:ESX-1 secretion-associated protein EspI-like n=1 Tax=Amphibalanus amphitrite TaxID=1232801 RepID=UPI001C915AF8
PGGSGAAPPTTTVAASCQTSPEEGNTPSKERLIMVRAGQGAGPPQQAAARRKYAVDGSDESEQEDSMYASLGLRTSVTARHGSDRSLTPVNEPAAGPPPPPPPLPASRPSSATVAPAAAPTAVPAPLPAVRRAPAGRRPASAGRPPPPAAAQREVTPYRSTYPPGADEAARLFTARVPARALPLPFEAYRPESPAPSVPPRRYRQDSGDLRDSRDRRAEQRTRRDGRRRRHGRHGDDVQVRVETETVEIVSGSGSESEDGSSWAEPVRPRLGAGPESAADIGRMRRRFHTLLDDAFNSLDSQSRGGRWRCRSAAPSRNRSADGPELAVSPPRRPASALERRSVPTQVSLSPSSPGHKSAWTTTDDLSRSAAAAAGPPPLRLLPGRTGVTSSPMRRGGLSPLEPGEPLCADDPAVPLIRAIQEELRRFGDSVPTGDTDV